MPKYRVWDDSEFDKGRERKGKNRQRRNQTDEYSDFYWDKKNENKNRWNKKHPERR